MCKCNDCGDTVKDTCWCQNKKTPHVHAKLIKAWADSPSLVFQVQVPDGKWVDIVCGPPSWDLSKSYRIKPQPPQELDYASIARSAWLRANEFQWKVCAEAVLKAKAEYDKAVEEFNKGC